MAVERTSRDVRSLIAQVAAGEIRLPEIQRGYVWKATQVARLIESLYRGYPTGSLLVWKTMDLAETREASIGAPQALSRIIPLYLLDGQQRLTSLFRVLTDHPEAQVVFNVETEAFQNQSAATLRNRKWLKVYDAVSPEADIFAVHSDLKAAGLNIDDSEIGRRLRALQKITERDFHIEVLEGFEYEEVAEIFVRVNSGGRALKTTDLALAALSARSPGFLGRLEAEAARWAGRGYSALDVNFLIKALTLNLSISGKRLPSVAKLTTASPKSVDMAWEKVRYGLSRTVPMLQDKLLIPSTSLIPSLAAIYPLVVYYGDQVAEAAASDEMDRGMLYWFLAATARNRYGGATDTALTQDIKALDSPNPVQALLANLGLKNKALAVTADDLAGRGRQSPYLMFCYLAVAHAGATDWWDGTSLASAAFDGEGKLRYSLVHPAAALRKSAATYTPGEVNELANLAFVSAQTAKNVIGSLPPAIYMREVSASDRTAHAIPDSQGLLDPDAYRDFLAARRAMLAARITAVLDRFKPASLTASPGSTPGRETRSLLFKGFAGGGRSVLVADAEQGSRSWVCWIRREDLEAALDAASTGLACDVPVGSESAPMRIDDEGIITLELGPFAVRGSMDQWRSTVKEAFDEVEPFSECPEPTEEQWDGETMELLLSEAGVRITSEPGRP